MGATWRAAWRLGATPTFLVLVGLGLANLLGGVVLAPSGTGAGRAVLECLHANFTPFVWAAMVWAAANTRAEAPPFECAAALALLGLGALTLGGLVALGHQLATAPADSTLLEPVGFLRGVYFNLGWPTVQLAALLAASRALHRNRWVGVATATVAALALNLLCSHPLLTVGAPVSVWSALNGYGPALPAHLAAGALWSGAAVLLLIAAEWHRGRHLSRGLAAAAWLAFCASGLAAAWLLNERDRTATPSAVRTPDPASVAQAPPVYTRGELTVEFAPHIHRVRSRGALILANRGSASVPVLHFGLRPGTAVRRLALTGELVSATPILRSYRLNRPLEPKETLKIAFDFSWADPDTILANGASACLADLVPLPGGTAPGPRTSIDPCPRRFEALHTPHSLALRLRIGTAVDQIAIAPGEPTSAWKENGRAFFEYTPNGRVSLAATVHSGRYAIANENWRGVAIRAYHHPAHAHLAPRMLAHGASALATTADAASETRDAPRARRWLHVVEVPDYTPLVRPPALLGLTWHTRAPPPPVAPKTGVLRYSEHGQAPRA